MNRYICIHGHFYQPPRENAWLEKVELQDSAYPYHDWNTRISAECYGPNAASRILDSERKIIDIVNNYARMSFNVGPTLLSWLEKEEPEIYKAILEADKESQKYFSGHGAAIAQCYNHMIMPLANQRDKKTQVVWGIRDFESRFKRKPEGMWLPETAVNMEALEVLAESGIKFTILAPHQAKSVKRIDEHTWHDVSNGRIDPKMPYLCRLGSGKTIGVFFYDGPISASIAFGDLLSNGEHFASRLMGAFRQDTETQLVHIATDGETFGHHHRFGDMALAYCIHHIEASGSAKVTIYAEHLEKFPPKYEVEINENTSWSCSHGIERWRSNCGCSTGSHAKWKQNWRAPLRGAMDWLRDELVKIYEEGAKSLFKDPWNARNSYIDVILSRGTKSIDAFLSKEAVKRISKEDKVKALKLLEMQKNAMLMYTSCGWFFEDISGIETVQIIQYAARAMQLANEVAGIKLEETYIGLLEEASSNVEEFKNGKEVYEIFVKPSVIDIVRVGVHYAISSLFEDYPHETEIYTYTVRKKSYDKHQSDSKKIALGIVEVTSNITLEEENVGFAMLFLGVHNIMGGAKLEKKGDSSASVYKEIKNSFLRNQSQEAIRIIDKNFDGYNYSLWHLFRDSQRAVINKIFDTTLREVEELFKEAYECHYPVIQAVGALKIPIPKYYSLILEFILNSDIIKQVEAKDTDFNLLQKLISDAKLWTQGIDKTTLGFVASAKINSMMSEWKRDVENVGMLDKIVKITAVLRSLSLDMNLWKSQNIYFDVGKRWHDVIMEKKSRGSAEAKKWLELFKVLEDYLKVKVK